MMRFKMLYVSILFLSGVSLASFILFFVSGLTGGRSYPSGWRIRSDHRSLATAIESYFLDHKVYPPMEPMRLHEYAGDGLEKAGGWYLAMLHGGNSELHGITTPVAYITSLFPDPYANDRGLPFAYYTDGFGWTVFSTGPDLDYDLNKPHEVYDGKIFQPSETLYSLTYDPSNGTESSGDIWRVKQ